MRKCTESLFVTLLAFLAFSCKENIKDVPRKNPIMFVDVEKQENERIEKVVSLQKITTNLVITTVDAQGNSLVNVGLRVGTDEFFTDSKGLIIIENIELNRGFVFIEASKSGFEKNLKTITPSRNGLTIVEIMLLVDVPSQSIDANNGGKLTFGTVEMDFPSHAIITADGSEYTGNVTVNTVYHAPTDETFTKTRPGVLVGITDDNELTALISEGMLTVYLTDDYGSELNISNGSKVKITMPASDNAPEIIPLWHLNETHGLWVEAGEALKNDGVYEFEVTHFSSYNLDWKIDPISAFYVKFQDQVGKPIVNQNINVNYLGSKFKYVTTDNNGEVYFLSAPGGDFTFAVDFPCGDLSLSTMVSVSENQSYTAVMDLSRETSVSYFNYNGTLTFCDDELAKNKAFTIELLDDEVRKYMFGYSDANGNYSVNSYVCNVESKMYPACVHVLDNGFDKVNNFQLDLTQSEFELNLSGCDFVIPVVD